MSHTNLIANALKDAGFETRVFNMNQSLVFVSLTNRKVSTLEVKTVLLNNLFDEDDFNTLGIQVLNTDKGAVVKVI